MNDKLDALQEVRRKMMVRLERGYTDLDRLKTEVAAMMDDLEKMVQAEKEFINECIEMQAQDHAERASNKEPEISIGLKD